MLRSSCAGSRGVRRAGTGAVELDELVAADDEGCAAVRPCASRRSERSECAVL